MSNFFSAVRKINPRGVEDDVLEIFVDTYDRYRLNNLVAEAYVPLYPDSRVL